MPFIVFWAIGWCLLGAVVLWRIYHWDNNHEPKEGSLEFRLRAAERDLDATQTQLQRRLFK